MRKEIAIGAGHVNRSTGAGNRVFYARREPALAIAAAISPLWRRSGSKPNRNGHCFDHKKHGRAATQ